MTKFNVLSYSSCGVFAVTITDGKQKLGQTRHSPGGESVWGVQPALLGGSGGVADSSGDLQSVAISFYILCGK